MHTHEGSHSFSSLYVVYPAPASLSGLPLQPRRPTLSSSFPARIVHTYSRQSVVRSVDRGNERADEAAWQASFSSSSFPYKKKQGRGCQQSSILTRSPTQSQRWGEGKRRSRRVFHPQRSISSWEKKEKIEAGEKERTRKGESGSLLSLLLMQPASFSPLPSGHSPSLFCCRIVRSVRCVSSSAVTAASASYVESACVLTEAWNI